ncbi:MAG TPA: arsenate reductase ArsC [Nitrososphaeraceae archaeon]|nr:arsenate reductase ArsC [Nitrososphaeraceae archaeon]
MKFFGKSKKNEYQQKDKKVLFLCVENAGRSQMAEGFFKKYAPNGLTPLSAGTNPAYLINPVVVEAMKEVGIDISKQKSKELTEEMIRESNKVVNMGCMNKNFCPTIWLPKVIEWNLEDPKGKSIEEIRQIRDEIEKKVKEIVVAETTTTTQI